MKTASLLLSSLLVSFTLTAHASKAPLIFEGTDIRPAVEYLKKEVMVLQAPITVYNWTPAGKSYEAGNKAFAKKGAASFWLNYGTNPSGSMYGNGLYGAMDPASSEGFGGTRDWLLTEMQLPPGTNLIDVDALTGQNINVPPEVEAVAKAFECPAEFKASKLFTSGGVDVPKKCQGLVKVIYKNILQLQGFFYGYGTTNFKDCSTNYEGQRAIVITDSSWMNDKNVLYYTAKTTDKLEERRRLVTLMLKAKEDPTRLDFALLPMADYLEAHPESMLKGSKTVCDGTSCVVSVEFCDPKNTCEILDLPKIPRPGGPLITRPAIAASTAKDILWSDLENTPKSKTVTEWLKENKYMCNGNSPFKKK